VLYFEVRNFKEYQHYSKRNPPWIRLYYRLLHDRDKIDDIDGFFADFKTGFKTRDWWDRHKKMNRHHLAEQAPLDVTLIDVLEYIADCVMAGMARSGEIYEIDIDPEVLMRAFDNTVELLKNNVTLEPEPEF
jgi:hypothetical protein